MAGAPGAAVLKVGRTPSTLDFHGDSFSRLPSQSLIPGAHSLRRARPHTLRSAFGANVSGFLVAYDTLQREGLWMSVALQRSILLKQGQSRLTGAIRPRSATLSSS